MALDSWFYLSSKEAKSFPLAPMGATPRKAYSGYMTQKMPKSGAPENKKQYFVTFRDIITLMFI